MVASSMQQPGIPDRYVVGKGLPGCWWEAKKNKGTLRPDQRHWIEERLPFGCNILLVRYFGSTICFQHPLTDEMLIEVEWREATGPSLRAAFITALKLLHGA